MKTRTRDLAPWALLAAACSVVAGWLAMVDGFAFTDYDSEASAAFRYLAQGDLTGFASSVPSYGGSLVLRAPFALIAGLLGAGDDALYRTVSLPGLLAAAVLATGLVAVARRRGWSGWACLAIVGVATAGPPMVSATQYGHAEELLIAALAIGSVLAARGGRPWVAGLLLGLAVAGKPWAIIAAGPVLLSLPGVPWRPVLAAAAVGVCVLGPLAVADHGIVASSKMAATDTGTVFKAPQIWWFSGHRVHREAGDTSVRPGARVAPAWLSRTSRPMIVLAAAALALLWWRRRSRSDVLGLLTLVFLVRCLLDPWDNLYYHAPFLAALLAWEVHAGRRAPWAALSAALALRLSLVFVPQVAGVDAQAVAYLTWAVPTLGLIALTVFAPARARALAAGTTVLARRLFPTLAGRTAGSPA